MSIRFTFKQAAATVILLAVAAALQPRARAQGSEYQFKAAYIINFLQGVRWPAKAFPDAAAPFTIGICGSDPFGGMLGGQTVADRKVVFKKSRRVEDLKGCQLVFVTKGEGARMNEIIDGLKGSFVLTVGETEGFAAKGGVINFVRQGDQVSYELNAGAARRNGLEIGSKVLRPAKPVGH